MAALLKSKVAAAAGIGVLLVLLATSTRAAAAVEEELIGVGNEGPVQQNICALCLSQGCNLGYCSFLCPGVCSGAGRKDRAGREDRLRQPDYYCVLCWHKSCPASCRSGCPRYCGRASSE